MKDNIGLLKKLDYHNNLSKLSYEKTDVNGNKTCFNAEYQIKNLINRHKNTPDDIYENNEYIIITQELTENNGSKCFNIINKATLDKVLLNNNQFCYEYITSKKNIWYKFPIDIEYELIKNND